MTAKKKWKKKKKKKKDCRRKQRQQHRQRQQRQQRQQRVPAAGLVAAGHQRLPTALSEPSLADRNAAADRDRDGRLAVLGPPPIPVA